MNFVDTFPLFIFVEYSLKPMMNEQFRQASLRSRYSKSLGSRDGAGETCGEKTFLFRFHNPHALFSFLLLRDRVDDPLLRYVFSISVPKNN